jgi:uncharacterized protein
MRTLFPSFLSGLLFGAGLTVSQMVNPAKVIDFLDVAGRWDPSLALVMVSALVVTSPFYRRVLGWNKPLCAAQFHLPTLRVIDAKLIAGAALFGVGWGLAGLCPGPAVASLSYGRSSIAFVGAMVGAMVAWEARGAILKTASGGSSESLAEARPESI